MDTLKHYRLGRNIYFYGEIVSIAADTLKLRYTVPRGMVIRVMSLAYWHDAGSTKSVSWFMLREDAGKVADYSALQGTYSWRIHLESVTTATNTTPDLAKLKGPLEFGEYNVLEFTTAPGLAAKTFKVTMSAYILEEEYTE